MAYWTKKKVRKLNIEWHRDLGYFFTVLIIVYCISGIALNHVNDWNPDFIIQKKEIPVPEHLNTKNFSKQEAEKLGENVGEKSFRILDFPTDDQAKIYYDNASLHINFTTNTAAYERVNRRPVFYQANLMHRNSVKGWKWASDIFAFLLIVLSVTGLFVLKGKKGIKGRGKWFIMAGVLPILVVLLIYQFS